MANRHDENEEIKKLREELRTLRRWILGRAPEALREVLQEGGSCSSDADEARWEGRAIGQVIQQAVVLPPQAGYNGDRAMCPLCGEGASQAFYNPEGWAMPRGLRHHLQGINTRQCVVMGAAIARAMDTVKRAETERETDSRS